VETLLKYFISGKSIEVQGRLPSKHPRNVKKSKCTVAAPFSDFISTFYRLELP